MNSRCLDLQQVSQEGCVSQLWQTVWMLFSQQDHPSVIITIKHASFCLYAFPVSLTVCHLLLPISIHSYLVYIWRGTVYPGFPVLLHPVLQKGTRFLLSGCRSIPTDVQFVTLDFLETALCPISFFVATLCFFHGIMAFLQFSIESKNGWG